MRPALRPGPARDQPAQRTPSLFEDLGAVARLYGTVFWMIGQRLQHGRRWEQKLTSDALRSYGYGAEHDARKAVRHPN